MRIPLPTLLAPPLFAGYEKSQKARLLHYMLLAVFIGGLVGGVVSLFNDWWMEALLEILLAIVCLAAFYLNRAQFINMAGVIFCASLYFVMGFLLYYGIGLYDSVLMGFPIFVLCATFLFRRRGLVVATVMTVAAFVAIYLLEKSGLYLTSYPASLLRLVMLSLLTIIMAIVIWVIRDTWQTNLTQLQKSYDLTLQGWAKAVEYRDGDTAGHSRRVAELSVSLARKLGIDEDELLNIRRGAYLHDIGKLAIPDQILLKPGALNVDERKVMERHPVLARDFVSEIPFLQSAIDILYWHHERWDGRGYPDGLAGENIPLAARIFTVVDHWDALTSDRPYRLAWTREDATSYLHENAGAIFDPHVVNVFLDMLEE